MNGTEDKINSLLSALGVEVIGEIKASSSFKFGIDPTSDKLHLGHWLILLTLYRLKMLCSSFNFNIVLGTFTATIGDPSFRLNGRSNILNNEQTTHNAMGIQTFIQQKLGNTFQFHRNSDWLNQLKLSDFFTILNGISSSRLLERKEIKNRLEKYQTVLISEVLYPILQGYDSVVLHEDIEVGGMDQRLNLLVSRDIQSKVIGKQHTIMLFPLLLDSKGKKIGKSDKNSITISDSPIAILRKLMLIHESDLLVYGQKFEKLSNESLKLECIAKTGIRGKLEFCSDFMLKILLIPEVDVESAKSLFAKKFIEKNGYSSVHIENGETILDLITKFLKMSKTKARKLVEQKAVKINSITNINTEYILKANDKIIISKKYFVICNE